MNITLQQLEAFLEISRKKSFSLAAESLHLSQPAVSLSIKKMEDELGICLFDRTTREVRLTEAGKFLYSKVERISSNLENCLSELKEMATGTHGTIIISCLPSLAALILPEIIVAFTKKFPKIKIFIKDELADGIIHSVRSGESHLGISIFKKNIENLEFTPLLYDKFYVLCRKDHPLASQKTVAWDELNNYKIVTMPIETSVRQQLEATFTKNGRHLRPVQEASFLATLGGMVKADIGVTLLPSFTFPLLPNHNDLEKILFTDPVIEREIGLLNCNIFSSTPSVDVFKKEIHSIIKNDISYHLDSE